MANTQGIPVRSSSEAVLAMELLDDIPDAHIAALYGDVAERIEQRVKQINEELNEGLYRL